MKIGDYVQSEFGIGRIIECRINLIGSTLWIIDVGTDYKPCFYGHEIEVIDTTIKAELRRGDDLIQYRYAKDRQGVLDFARECWYNRIEVDELSIEAGNMSIIWMHGVMVLAETTVFNSPEEVL